MIRRWRRHPEIDQYLEEMDDPELSPPAWDSLVTVALTMIVGGGALALALALIFR